MNNVNILYDCTNGLTIQNSFEKSLEMVQRVSHEGYRQQIFDMEGTNYIRPGDGPVYIKYVETVKRRQITDDRN